MILEPPILALLTADMLTVALLIPAAGMSWNLLRHWDPASGDARQLRLEKQTYLVASVLTVVLALQPLLLPLFVHIADGLAARISGAMCAIGSLQANPWGFPALYLRILLFFVAMAWLVVRALDIRARDYPLIRVQHGLVLLLLPLAAANLALHLLYFLQLDTTVIVSCCGSLFSAASGSVSGHLAAWPPGPALWLYFSTLGLILVAGLHYLLRRRGLLAFGLSGVAGFPVAILGIVAFLSLYIYEHPLHHCPFCILKPEFGHVGYPIYALLFTGAALTLGLSVVALVPSGRTSLPRVLDAFAPRFVALSGAAYLALGILSVGLIWRSNLLLL